MKMKRWVGIWILMLLSLSVAGQTGVEKMKKIEWLLGNWNRTNVRAPRTGAEIWKKSSEESWIGRGITMKGKDTIFVEKIRIAVENDRLYYIADVPENKKPVYFEILEVGENTFTCENPQHDFPKKIYYRLEGTKLYAKVSGAETDRTFEYWFERSK